MAQRKNTKKKITVVVILEHDSLSVSPPKRQLIQQTQYYFRLSLVEQ